MSNKFYTDEEAQELQKLDVFTYLYNYEPSELVKSGKKEYRTATHSSLVISNGKWIWFSQGKGGVSAISYLMDVKGMNYYEAVKYVDKCIRDSPPVYHVNKCSKTNDGIFKLPPVSKDNKKMMYYLKNKRKIDKEVIDIIKAQHGAARRILMENRAKLDELAQYLYEKETITGDEFMNILKREGGSRQ